MTRPTLDQTTQATDDAGNRRWYVDTPAGRKVTWAQSERQAKEKAKRAGHRVIAVYPAPPMVEHLKPKG